MSRGGSRGNPAGAPQGPPSGPLGTLDASAALTPARPQVVRQERIALVDLLDRVLAGGVVVAGEVRLSIADVDMVTISLQALISAVSTAFPDVGDIEDERP